MIPIRPFNYPDPIVLALDLEEFLDWHDYLRRVDVSYQLYDFGCTICIAGNFLTFQRGQ